MTYELAKQLKDNGFPMPKYVKVWAVKKEHPDYLEDKGYASPEVDLPEDGILIPTLEELIEACGANLVVLRNMFKYWMAYGDDPETSVVYISCEGKTPSEAVAKLWLEINKTK